MLSGNLRILLLGLLAFCMFSCNKPAGKPAVKNSPSTSTYENELFSVDYPKDWVCDYSGWNGLDSLKNEVDIYDPNDGIVWFHFVKTFLPMRFENIYEAKEMAKAARAFSGDNVELIYEEDSVEIGGYPASVLLFANFVDNDTIIQKQFVTYLPDSHIVVYFNENFYAQHMDEAQKIGDRIIATIKLKQVKNPLDNDSVLRKIVKGLDPNSVQKKYMDRARQIIGQHERKRQP